MIKYITSALTFFIALFTSFSHAQTTIVPFYIIIGQSNTGWTSANGMTSQEAASYGGSIPNTEIWNPGKGAFSASWEPMTVGVNTMCENYVSTTQFGPEASFFKSLQNQKSRKRMIFKQGQGGTTLAHEWKPTLPYEGSDGGRWLQFKEWLQLAVSQANARNIKLDLRAVIWMQGEDDALTLANANAYYNNLNVFFTTIASVWQGHVNTFNLPVTSFKKVIGRIYAPVGYPYRDIVRAAEADYCANPANNAVLINTDSYPLQDWVHYNPTGQIQFGLDIFNAASYEPTEAPVTGVTFTGKVFLQGAYNSTSGNMKNDLNSLGILQSFAKNQPYNSTDFNYGGSDNVGAGFFASHTDIVDWVLVELRSASTPFSLVLAKAAFIKQDGSIVDIDGSSPVSFIGVARSSYTISIRHRNHLGIRSAATVDFSSGSANYDFTTSAGKSFQNQSYPSTVSVNGVWMMRGGNANSNNNVKYNGPSNDQDRIQNIALEGSFSMVKSNVYSCDDVNMDGSVKANGPSNDQNFLLNITLGGFIGNVMIEQL